MEVAALNDGFEAWKAKYPVEPVEREQALR
jgi:hypothetical protein